MLDAASWAVRLGGDSFLAQTLHRSYAVVRGEAADAAGLLSWDDLNALLGNQRLEPPRLRLSLDGATVDQDRYTVPVTNRRAVTWHRLQPAALHAQLAAGASLVLDAIDAMHPPIGAAAEGLERFLGTSVQVNAYASWTEREGFGTHWDDHDVVVVQVHGSKRWKLYGPTRTAPTYRDVEAPEPPQGESVADLVLSAGDVLYLPRGWWHAVTADQGTASLHLTFGLVTHTGAELMNWVVEQLHSRVALRQDVPRFGTPREQAAFVRALREAMTVELADPDLVSRWAESADSTHVGRAVPSLPFVGALPARAEITVRLTAPRARLTEVEAEGTVTFAAAGTEWDFTQQLTPLLRALLDGSPVTLGDLARLADVEVKDVAEVVSVLVEGQVAAVVGTAL